MPETRTTSSTGGQKGVKLARFDLIPAGPLRLLAEHYGRGAKKYADHQWRKGYEWSKSISALHRHMNDFEAGKDFDVCSNDPTGCSFTTFEGLPYEPDETDTCYNHTGSHHLAAAAWHAFGLLEFTETHPEHDDRYRPEKPVDISRLGPPDAVLVRRGRPLTDGEKAEIAKQFQSQHGRAPTIIENHHLKETTE